MAGGCKHGRNAPYCEDCNPEVKIDRLTIENAVLRELLNTAREQLLNVDDDPFEPYPERDQLIDDIRDVLDAAVISDANNQGGNENEKGEINE